MLLKTWKTLPHTLSISHSITLDMLNRFCFHLYAENSLFIAEKCNAFFDIIIITLSCDSWVHRAGSQLKTLVEFYIVFWSVLSYQAQGPPPSPSLVDPSVAPRPGHSSFQVSRLSHCKLAWVMHLLINSIITCMKPLAMTVWQMETRTAFFMIRGSILSPENYLFIPPQLRWVLAILALLRVKKSKNYKII